MHSSLHKYRPQLLQLCHHVRQDFIKIQVNSQLALCYLKVSTLQSHRWLLSLDPTMNTHTHTKKKEKKERNEAEVNHMAALPCQSPVRTSTWQCSVICKGLLKLSVL